MTPGSDTVVSYSISPAREDSSHGPSTKRLPISGGGAPRDPGAALQPPHRGCLSGLDQAVHPVPWQAAPGPDGRNRGRRVSHRAGGERSGGGGDAESGAQCHRVPLQGGARTTAGRNRWGSAGEVVSAPAGGTDRGRSAKAAAPLERHPLAGSLPAVRLGVAPDGGGTLRVKDIDFDHRAILVRDGKGAKDRVVTLADGLVMPLHQQLEYARMLHDKDCADGFGTVYLPFALERKYPNAPREWHWQYVFPSGNRSIDPRSGTERRHHIDESSVQKAIKLAGIISCKSATTD